MKNFFKNTKLLLLIAICLLFYVLNNVYIRPYVYDSVENRAIVFLVGVLPNFLGTLMFGAYVRCFVTKSFVKTFVISMSLPIFMEVERYFYGNHNFDFYDLIASAIAVVVIFISSNHLIKARL